MKILALLAALWLCHLRPDLARLRRYDWLLALPRRLAGHGPDWLPAAGTAILALLAGAVLAGLAEALAGPFGLLLIGTAAVVYTLGPRDLDADIRSARDTGNPARRQATLERMLIREHAGGPQAAGAVLHAALARWFGTVFWFALLGVAGCLLYRAVREVYHRGGLEGAAHQAAGRLLAWLNWPVMLLLVGALALMTDYDRVRSTFAAREDRWELPPALLDDLARSLCDGESDLAEGLVDGRRLAWRVLLLWMAVLSALLLIGWIQ